MSDENIYFNEDKVESLSSRRKWQNDKVYQSSLLTNDEDKGFTHEMSQNLSLDERNLSDELDKTDHVTWMSSSSNSCSNKNELESLEGVSSDSGLSLNNSIETDDTIGWIGSNNLIQRNNSRIDWNKTATDYNESSHQNIPCSVEEILNKKPYSSLTLNEFSDYDDIGEFYTPRSSWRDETTSKQSNENIPEITSSANLPDDRRLDGKKSVDEVSCSGIIPRTKRVGRSADILARVQKSPSCTSNDGRENMKDLKQLKEFEQSTSSEINKLNINARLNKSGGIPNTTKSDYLSSDTKWRLKKTDVEKRNNIDKVKKENPNVISKEVGSSNQTKSDDKLQDNTKGNESNRHLSGMAKSLIHLAHIKRSNKNAVADFLKTLVSCSDSNEKNECHNIASVTSAQDKPSDARGRSKEKLVGQQSDESLKWHFPNSNRKREEKLRASGNSIVELSLQHANTSSRNDKNKMKEPQIKTPPSKLEQKITHSNPTVSKKQSQLQMVSSKNQPKQNSLYSAKVNGNKALAKKKEDFTWLNSKLTSGGNEWLKGMGTQSALLYLSETLIDSAQRAEVLLMQKMKEYNDLVCRDPPEKKKQDFTCQAQIMQQQAEHNFQIKLNDIGDKFKKELTEKNDKIKQLENDKKKLRHIVKKLSTSLEQKSGDDEPEEKNEYECLDSITGRSNASDTERSYVDNDELVQALKLENNFLHTLLKEMKTELDQENATILSLAKKLEMSLGQQTQKNPKKFEMDVVKQLEDKLEQQEKMLKQEAMEARAVAKYVIMKYKKLIQEYKHKVKSHQETVDKLTIAIK